MRVVRADGNPLVWVPALGGVAEIRQGVKDLSNWPTFPQLYVNQELVGGSDIMMEMYESGELQQLLAKA
jgi:glutaredoxin-related protein